MAVFGVAIGSYLVIMRTRHPKADRPLIDYDFVMLIEPTILLGSLVGVYFNVMFPTYVIVLLLGLMLSLSAYKTMKKGMDWYKKELDEAEREGKAVEMDKFIDDGKTNSDNLSDNNVVANLVQSSQSTQFPNMVQQIKIFFFFKKYTQK